MEKKLRNAKEILFKIVLFYLVQRCARPIHRSGMRNRLECTLDFT